METSENSFSTLNSIGGALKRTSGSSLTLNWIALPIFIACALLVMSCASSEPQKERRHERRHTVSDRPVVGAAPVMGVRPGRQYIAAEKLFDDQEYERAADAFLAFVATAGPDDPLIDNAYFKTALSWFEQGRYREALYYFETVLDRYPESDVVVSAMIDAAICHYALKEPGRAEELFEEALPQIASKGQKAFILFYQAKGAEERGAFAIAGRLYIESERIAEDEELISSARNRTRKILHNFLGVDDLKKITRAYSGSWAAEDAFNELFMLYRRSGDTAELAAARAAHAKQFPVIEAAPELFFGSMDENYVPADPSLGVSIPVTGPGAAVGREILQGIKLALTSQGELIRARRLSVVIKDSGGKPAKAERGLRELMRDRNTIAILGPVYSGSFERAVELSKKTRTPTVSPSATGPGIAARSPYLFRNSLTPEQEAEKLAHLMVNQLGKRRVAVLYPDTAAGRSRFGWFRGGVERLGGRVVAAESYNPRESDYSEQIKKMGGVSDDKLRKAVLTLAKKWPTASPEKINRILAARSREGASYPVILKDGGELPLTDRNFLPGLKLPYDAVTIFGPAEALGLMMGQLQFYNVRGVPRLVGRNANSVAFLKTAERYAEGIYFYDAFYAPSADLGVRDFVKRYRLAFREEPTALAAQGYDAARMILSALAHGARSRGEIRNFLAKLNHFEGATGVTSMRPNGEPDKELFALTIHNGKIVERSTLEKENGAHER